MSPPLEKLKINSDTFKPKSALKKRQVSKLQNLHNIPMLLPELPCPFDFDLGQDDICDMPEKICTPPTRKRVKFKVHNILFLIIIFKNNNYFVVQGNYKPSQTEKNEN